MAHRQITYHWASSHLQLHHLRILNLFCMLAAWMQLEVLDNFCRWCVWRNCFVSDFAQWFYALSIHRVEVLNRVRDSGLRPYQSPHLQQPLSSFLGPRDVRRCQMHLFPGVAVFRHSLYHAPSVDVYSYIYIYICLHECHVCFPKWIKMVQLPYIRRVIMNCHYLGKLQYAPVL